MVLSTSDLRDPQTPFLSSEIILYFYNKKIFVPIDHYDKFNILNWDFVHLITPPHFGLKKYQK